MRAVPRTPAGEESLLLILHDNQRLGRLSRQWCTGLPALLGQLGPEGQPGLTVAVLGRAKPILGLEQGVSLERAFTLVVIPARLLRLVAALDQSRVAKEAGACRQALRVPLESR